MTHTPHTQTHIPIPALASDDEGSDPELSESEMQALGELDVSFLTSLDARQIAQRNQRYGGREGRDGWSVISLRDHLHGLKGGNSGESRSA